MAEPGWYPDPGGAGSRFWDGGAWTDRVVADRPAGRGVPGWVLVGWWVLMALVAVGAFWFVVLMTAFGCDSGWDGCVGAGEATWGIYAGISAVGLIGLLVWGLLSKTPGPRIVAFVLMPVTVVLAVLVAFAAYWLMATLLA